MAFASPIGTSLSVATRIHCDEWFAMTISPSDEVTSTRAPPRGGFVMKSRFCSAGPPVTSDRGRLTGHSVAGRPIKLPDNALLVEVTTADCPGVPVVGSTDPSGALVYEN